MITPPDSAAALTPNSQRFAKAAARFVSEDIAARGGPDPTCALYTDRRASFSLFSVGMTDADCAALRPYLFGAAIPKEPGDTPVTCLNLIDGAWQHPAELVSMASPADQRITLFRMARSRERDCVPRDRPSPCLFGRRSHGQNETLAYRKHVIQNFLHAFCSFTTRTACTRFGSRFQRRGWKRTRTFWRPSARPITCKVARTSRHGR